MLNIIVTIPIPAPEVIIMLEASFIICAAFTIILTSTLPLIEGKES